MVLKLESESFSLGYSFLFQGSSPLTGGTTDDLKTNITGISLITPSNEALRHVKRDVTQYDTTWESIRHRKRGRRNEELKVRMNTFI